MGFAAGRGATSRGRSSYIRDRNTKLLLGTQSFMGHNAELIGSELHLQRRGTTMALLLDSSGCFIPYVN